MIAAKQPPDGFATHAARAFDRATANDRSRFRKEESHLRGKQVAVVGNLEEGRGGRGKCGNGSGLAFSWGPEAGDPAGTRPDLIPDASPLLMQASCRSGSSIRDPQPKMNECQEIGILAVKGLHGGTLRFL